MAKVDFISLSNIIFKDKDKYKYVTDEEKHDSFFKLNRKLAADSIKLILKILFTISKF